jgi:hypothetical protein
VDASLKTLMALKSVECARFGELGLAEEEVAFYDAIAANLERVYDEAFLRDLAHDVVQMIKRPVPRRDSRGCKAGSSQARRSRRGLGSVHRPFQA